MNWLEMLWHDIHHSIRTLARAPVFTLIAMLTLALGIAGATIVFGILKKIAIEPLPYPDSKRIMAIYTADTSGTSSVPKLPFSYLNYQDLIKQNRSFSVVGAYAFQSITVGGDAPTMVYGLDCTASLGKVLGLKMSQGRWFSDVDEQANAGPVAVVGYQFWKNYFNSDRGLVGRQVKINGRDCTIIGVMPEGVPIYSRWRYGDCGDVFLPQSNKPDRGTRGQRRFAVVGMLKPGVSEQAASLELNALGERLAKEYPASNSHKTIRMQPFSSEVFGRLAAALSIMECAVFIVILLACANVAGMLIARSARRQTEMSVRSALGAGRWHLFRMMMYENAFISLGACVGGVILTQWGLAAVSRYAPSAVLSRGSIHVDGWVLAFAVAMAVITILLAGTIPAFMVSRMNVAGSIKEGATQQSGSLSKMRQYRLLIVMQIASTLLLVNTAVALTEYYREIVNDARSISSHGVVTAVVDFSGKSNRNNSNQVFSAQKRLLDAMRHQNGVIAAGSTTKLPFEGGSNSSILIDGETYDPQGTQRLAEFSFVSPGYFDAIGLTLLKGRTFAEADDRQSTGVVVVNETLAKTCWPGRDPIGKIVRPDARTPWYVARVIGVVADARQHGAEGVVMPEVYLPNSARPGEPCAMILRARGDARRFIPALREQVRQIDPEAPIANVRTMGEIFTESSRLLRFQTLVINCFMMLALLLAAIGIYGTLAFYVAAGAREIGIRIAMGASRCIIRTLVFGRVAPWLAVGIGVGISASLAAGGILRSALYGGSRLNPAYLGGAVLIVLCVAALACWIPVRRASVIDPINALRAE